MKSIFIYSIVVLTFLVIPTYAQKCHLSRDEKDAFSGEITRTFSHYVYVTKDGALWNFHFERKGNVYKWGYEPATIGRTPIAAPIGTKVMVKLADGTTIEDVLTEDAAPTYLGQTTQWKLLFKVSEETIRKFATSPITDIKTTIGTKEYYLSDLKDRRANIIQTAAECMIAKE